MSPGAFKLIAVRMHPGEMVSNCRAVALLGQATGRIASAFAVSELFCCPIPSMGFLQIMTEVVQTSLAEVLRPS